MATIIEVEYYNSVWLKRILTPETKYQITPDTVTGPTFTPSNILKGGAGTSPRRGVFPLSNVYANPQTQNMTVAVPGNTDTVISNGTSNTKENFYLEDMYIKGGFNNTLEV